MLTSEAESNAGKDSLMLMKIDNEPDEDHFMLSCMDYKKLIVAERKVLNHLRRHNELLSRKPNISLAENQTNKAGTNTRVEDLLNESLSDGHEEVKTNIHLAKEQEYKLDKLRKEWLSNGHGEKSNVVDNSSQQQGMCWKLLIHKRDYQASYLHKIHRVS